MPPLVLFVTASLLFAVGGVFMKASAGFTRMWPAVTVLGLFCAGAALMSRAMRHEDMGAAYILVLGLEAAFAYGISVVLFSEPVSLLRLGAILLVVAGVALLRL